MSSFKKISLWALIGVLLIVASIMLGSWYKEHVFFEVESRIKDSDVTRLVAYVIDSNEEKELKEEAFLFRNGDVSFASFRGSVERILSDNPKSILSLNDESGFSGVCQMGRTCLISTRKGYMYMIFCDVERGSHVILSSDARVEP